MTPDEILTVARTAGIRLEVRGDRLHVEAPSGVVTDELRHALMANKAELLARLSPSAEYVTLKPIASYPNGLTLPAAALRLVWDLEARGFTLALIPQPGTDEVQVEPAGALTDRDRAALHRWHRHVAAVVAYVDEVVA
jgi:predicted metal-dependent hydrolase